MTGHDDLLEHAIDEIVRVSCKGGTTSFALPDLRLCGAQEIIAADLDARIGAVRERERRNEFVSEQEKELLRYWRQNVPHAFVWSAPLGGPNLLLAVNAYGEPIGDPPEMILLAAHPAKFDLRWEVAQVGRAPGFRGPIYFDRWDDREKFHIGTLHIPPDAGLFTTCRFRRLNSEFAVRRLSRRDQRRLLLPYGSGVCPNGDEVLFNRDYKPAFVRSPQGVTTHFPNPHARPHFASRRWFYNDGHTEAQKRRRAEAALELCLAGEPLPPHWEAEEVADRPKRGGAKGRG